MKSNNGSLSPEDTPDFMFSLERNIKDIEYSGYPLKVEVVKYLDGSTRVNSVKFVHSTDEMEFIESIDIDQKRFENHIEEKMSKMWKILESQLC